MASATSATALGRPCVATVPNQVCLPALSSAPGSRKRISRHRERQDRNRERQDRTIVNTRIGIVNTKIGIMNGMVNTVAVFGVAG